MVACSFCSASSAACVSKVQGAARAAPSVSATDKKELLGGGEPLAPGAPRRVGLFAAVVAIAVVAFGIVERRHNEVTVAQWTEAQAIPRSRSSRQRRARRFKVSLCQARSRRGTRLRCTPAPAAI